MAVTDTPAVPAPASRSPEDHALVPLDPTPEMVEAGRAQMIDGGKMQTHARIIWVWEAMVRAAPNLSRDSGEAVKPQVVSAETTEAEVANGLLMARSILEHERRADSSWLEWTDSRLLATTAVSLSASAARLTEDNKRLREALWECLEVSRKSSTASWRIIEIATAALSPTAGPAEGQKQRDALVEAMMAEPDGMTWEEMKTKYNLWRGKAPADGAEEK